MKNNIVLVLICFLFGCSNNESKYKESTEIPSTLSEMVNNGLDSDLFYEVFPDRFPEDQTSIFFILPKSSCFNCFEDLTEELAVFYKEYGLEKIIVVRNDNIKDRAVRYSLQNVVPIDRMEILNIKDIDFVQPHDFFPKIGFIKNGNLSCIEVFEQGDIEKISNYFIFLKTFL